MNAADRLNDALDELIQGQQRRIVREYDRPGGKTERTHQLATTWSLWDQLTKSTSYQGNGGSVIGKPRLPIAAGIVDLTTEISTWAKEAADDMLGAQRKTTPATLRAVVAYINTHHETDLQTIWTARIHKWVALGRELLGIDPPHPKWIRDTACPTCGATNATQEDSGETTRTPALAITWAQPVDTTRYPPDDWTVRAVECRACSEVWWRGEPLEMLVAQMLAANLTRETMTDPAEKRAV